mgnify:CR=1 FL=1
MYAYELNIKYTRVRFVLCVCDMHPQILFFLVFSLKIFCVYLIS